MDYGDGTPVAYGEGDGAVKGSEIKIYGDNITSLYCSHDQLIALNVSNNSALTELSCINNQLTSLDISKCTALTSLGCNFNQLTSLDVTKNTALSSLDCNHNKLKFSTLKGDFYNKYHSGRIYSFQYEQQPPIFISSTIKAGEVIDLSSEYNLDGIITNYTWYDSEGNEVTPTQSYNGVFTFGKDFVGKTLPCAMTNDKFPLFKEDNDIGDGKRYVPADCRLATTEVTIIDEEEPTPPDTHCLWHLMCRGEFY